MKQHAIIFGRGIYFEKKKDSISEKYEIKAFLDNAVKPGSVEEKDGVKIYNPQNVELYFTDAKIILASNKWFEMWKQLMELGIEEDRIVFGSELAPFVDVIEELFHNEHITMKTEGKVLYLHSEGEQQAVSEETEFKKIVRKLFAKINPYIKLISDMPCRPVSKRFGQERGTAIDRFYIEKFLTDHRKDIKGTVMEIAEKRYIKIFPEDISEAVILHVNGWGENAIKGNLATGEGIIENSVDCMICTQTIQFIYDIHSVIKNIHKLLKPGGRVLLTASSISQISLYDYKNWGEYWKFTDQSMKKLMLEAFEEDQVEVCSYGNMKAAIAFMYGMCQEELEVSDLEYADEQFPMIVAAAARKV